MEDVEQLSFFVQRCCVCLRILGFGDDADGSFLEAMEWLKVCGVWLVGAPDGNSVDEVGVDESEVELAESTLRKEF